MLLRGKDVALLNPTGLIAQEQSHLMIFSVTVLLIVAIPTLFLIYSFAWRYRETSKKTRHDPNRQLSKFSAVGLWVIPIAVLVLLASVVLPATHKLDPHKAIASSNKPLTIQVIAMRWKWIFIYPEQNIATVNFVQIPVNTPVQFYLTADDAPMNSFWIPHLGGQLYAMTGHSNLLNLMADTPGDNVGSAAEINGEGFAGMKFTARASSNQEFSRWLQGVQLSSKTLNLATYNQLLVPSQNNPAAFYVTNGTDFYNNVLLKYGDTHGHHTEQQ
jgi:cytochrome o ubiquinol oxidase subunit 2